MIPCFGTFAKHFFEHTFVFFRRAFSSHHHAAVPQTNRRKESPPNMGVPGWRLFFYDDRMLKSELEQASTLLQP
jgi:hypothetical protein